MGNSQPKLYKAAYTHSGVHWSRENIGPIGRDHKEDNQLIWPFIQIEGTIKRFGLAFGPNLQISRAVNRYYFLKSIQKLRTSNGTALA
jgi:hypothetical protein